jgi:predicted Zn-dependent protease
VRPVRDTYVQLEHLLEVGRPAEARQLLSSAFAERPDDPDLRLYAARIALLEGDAREARRQLEGTLLHDPQSFQARYLLYFIDLDEGRHAEAEQRIVDLIRDHSHDPRLLASYADLMLRTLHLDKARRLVGEALRLDPQCRDARLCDALLSTVEGRRDRSDRQLADLVAQDPEAQKVAGALMVVLIDRNRPREALEIARQLLRVQPQNARLVDLIVALRAQTHWLAWPIRPLQRFGWGGSAAIWLGAVLVLGLLQRTQSRLALAAALVYLAWVVYSWTYTPAMTRWLRARGA